MVQLRFKTHEGKQIELDVPAEGTVMEAAVANGVEGILADCGGSMVCGTCHVQVSDEWQKKLPEQCDMETMILENVPDPQPNMRLCCQLEVNEDLDGIELLIPEHQR